MAKSKSGGTRSYIRGRVGADVYSIGRDAKGAKQQVVRSLAETVANPQTIAQMRGRMIMSTVMQAVTALRPIIDHSFDNVPVGQPSISEFISRNYALVKADVDAHPANGNFFELNAYQQKGWKQGQYILSKGDAAYPAGIVAAQAGRSIQIEVGLAPTFGTLTEGWGLSSEEFITLIGFTEIDPNNVDAGITPLVVRLSLKDGLAPGTVLTADNAAEAFNIEGNVTPTFSFDESKMKIHVNNDANSTGYGQSWSIVTRKSGSGFIHSTCQMITAQARNVNFADDVLPTYPVGTEMFLDGGDL